MDYISLGLVCEELEYVDTHLRVIMSVHVGLNCMTLLCWGTEEQKKKYLVPQAQGREDRHLRPDRAQRRLATRVGIQTTAVKKGDRYVLNGEKVWICLADVADHFLVIAWTDQEKKKNRDHSGLSAFIVERAFKGFSSYTIKEKWGILAGNTGGFHMDDVEVPVENRVGRGGRGLQGRHVRARERPLHGGRRRHRPHPRLPRRLRQVREGAQDLRRRRSASTSWSRR